MKKILLISAAWLILYSCNQAGTSNTVVPDSFKTGSAGETQSKEEHNKKVALLSVKSIPKWDFDGIFNETDPGVIDYGDGTTPPVKGIDSIKYYMKQGLDEFKIAFPDFKIENLFAVASGDSVLVWGIYSATWKKDIMGQKATGKSFKMPGVDYFLFNSDGKIVEHHYTSYKSEMAKQIGMK